MTPEGKVQAYLIKRAVETGGKARRVNWIGRRAAPDLLLWWKYPLAVWVEVKRLGQRPTPQQEREHTRLREDGWLVEWVDSKEMVDDLISHLTAPL